MPGRDGCIIRSGAYNSNLSSHYSVRFATVSLLKTVMAVGRRAFVFACTSKLILPRAFSNRAGDKLFEVVFDETVLE